MLYKVFMEEAFREDPDLVGFIEAQSIEAALEALRIEVASSWGDEELPEFSGSVTIRDIEDTANLQLAQTVSRLVARSTDEDGNTGRDVYMVKTLRSDSCLFHGGQWRELFKE